MLLYLSSVPIMLYPSTWTPPWYAILKHRGKCFQGYGICVCTSTIVVRKTQALVYFDACRHF